MANGGEKRGDRRKLCHPGDGGESNADQVGEDGGASTGGGSEMLKKCCCTLTKSLVLNNNSRNGNKNQHQQQQQQQCVHQQQHRIHANENTRVCNHFSHLASPTPQIHKRRNSRRSEKRARSACAENSNAAIFYLRSNTEDAPQTQYKNTLQCPEKLFAADAFVHSTD